MTGSQGPFGDEKNTERGTIMGEFEAVADELSTARRELNEALWNGAGALRLRAAEGDVIAAYAVERIDAAHDRLVASNITGTTALQERN